ncbi:major facilitator superfamily domain-containing protein [Mycena haematopus]|nr:major facilitator superfamily domain-containing protein [Mycena haematopus]
MTGLVIYPFVVQFVRDTGITGGDQAKTGFYAGMLESSFFLAEALTVYQFGRLSDVYGRRPVLLFAPLGLGLAMLGFGLSRSYWTLLGFRCIQGIYQGDYIQGAFNGNLGVAKTVMNEISDPSNVADIFSFLQLNWSLGSTMSPFMGGLLVYPAAKWPDSLGKIELLQIHPYFLPCAVAASVAFSSFAFAFFGLRETLPSAVERKRKERNKRPTESEPLLAGENLLTRDVRIALINHALLCFCDMAYDSLIPLVYSTPIHLGGLGLEPYHIGLIMGLCGFSNAIVQVFLGGRLIRYFGPRRVFICAPCALIFVFSTYPLLSVLSQRAGRVDAAVLVVLVCQLSCNFVLYFSFAATMLFIMDAAPNRASGQFNMSILTHLLPKSVASSLFALSVKHNFAGGYLVYIVLVGIACCALHCSLMLPRRLKSDPDSHSMQD